MRLLTWLATAPASHAGTAPVAVVEARQLPPRTLHNGRVERLGTSLAQQSPIGGLRAAESCPVLRAVAPEAGGAAGGV